ncbi:hypothetical protein N8Z10_00135 [bacterium]|nr:hypothetical protein [bacterium]
MLDETKLFDFIKILFSRNGKYDEVKNHNKKRHHFMINRFFAIKYPANAQMFNRNGINPIPVIDSWAMVAKRFTGVPGWIYTKTKKPAKVATKKSSYIPSENVIQFFMERNEIGKREYKELEKFAKEDLYATLKQLEDSMKVY